MLDRLYQVNLQTSFGGGEVYTAFLCRALDQLGVATTLLCHPEAGFWQSLALPASCNIVPTKPDKLVARLSGQRSWVLTHGPLNSTVAAALKQKHVLTAIAHMPPQGRPKDRYNHYQHVFGVSNYVNDGLRAIGVPIWNSPLYGVAALERNTAAQQALRQRSLYNWDQHKGRDKILAALEPWIEPLRSRPMFHRRDGLTLGIVSRLTPIKQFPALFEIIAPVLANHPEFNIEIFGSGGYASVRDMKQALQPLGKRARFWGQQGNVAAIYPQLDYLLTGLPEKEALGLNIIEAQACGTPVLAINAPPFNETIVDGSSGLFFVDPRQDGGADFDHLLSRIASLQVRIDPRLATEHLARFSLAAFVERLRPIVAWADNAVSLPPVIAR